MAFGSAAAFKILINAQPDQALSAFDKVMSATERAAGKTRAWGDTITALTQGFELMKNVAGFIVDIGTAAADAALKVGALLKEGGGFGEQSRQLEIIASSYGINADKIVEQTQRISGGTLAIGDAMKLAGKAINTGLSEDQIGVAFTYAKKVSEATGEDFQALGDKIVTAMASGRTATLKTYGIFAEKGEGATQIAERMAARLERFGDTGFNVGDAIDKISNAFGEMRIRVLEAIADVPALEMVFGGLADTIFDFVKSADFSQLLESVADWAEVTIQTGYMVVNELWPIIGGLIDSISGGFQGLTSGGPRRFFLTMIDYAFGFATAMGSVWNAITDGFDVIITIQTIWGRVLNWIVETTAYAIVDLADLVVEQVKAIAPLIYENLGLENFANQFGAKMNVVVTKLEKQFGSFDLGLEKDIAATGKYGINLEALGDAQARIMEGIMQIPTGISSAKAEFQKIPSLALNAGDALEKTMKKAVRGIAPAAKQAVDETGKAISQALSASFSSLGDAASGSFMAAADEVGALIAAKNQLQSMDRSAFGSMFEKERRLDEIQNMILQVQQEKARAQRLLEEQVMVQRDLALALNRENLVRHTVTVADSGAFINGFIETVFEYAGVRARSESVVVAGV